VSSHPDPSSVSLLLVEAAEEPMDLSGRLKDTKGAIGYIVLWLMGIPASILFLIFLMRGCT